MKTASASASASASVDADASSSSRGRGRQHQQQHQPHLPQAGEVWHRQCRCLVSLSGPKKKTLDASASLIPSVNVSASANVSAWIEGIKRNKTFVVTHSQNHNYYTHIHFRIRTSIHIRFRTRNPIRTRSTCKYSIIIHIVLSPTEMLTKQNCTQHRQSGAFRTHSHAYS